MPVNGDDTPADTQSPSAPTAPPDTTSPTTETPTATTDGTTPDETTPPSIVERARIAASPAHDLFVGPMAPPQLAGGSLQLANAYLSTHSALPGSEIEVRLEFTDLIPGLSSVRLAIGQHTLGDPVPVIEEHLRIIRQVPDMAPGSYDIRIMSGERVLDEIPFEVASMPVDPDRAVSSYLLIAAIVVLLGLTGWGWSRIRRSTSVR